MLVSSSGGGAIGVSHEIILSALALSIRLVFKILRNKSLNQCPWRSTPLKLRRHHLINWGRPLSKEYRSFFEKTANYVTKKHHTVKINYQRGVLIL
ncbi:hypothetical protein [Lapidilactobacillus wuchangensis]|uniref:hypothetical protein n=1 Tax=Lapidilactobacillus wuchangensis TaxID=2486001 RepID=UPI000F799FA8|nr:hypothetical protein [Lapidilactobacillus wuchangensis]